MILPELPSGEGKRAFIAGIPVAGDLPDNWRIAAGVGIGGILTDYPIELGDASSREAGEVTVTWE